MLPTPTSDVQPLTGHSTTYFGRVLPVFLTTLGGGVTAAAWLDVLGDGPTPTLVKLAILLVWMVMCVISFGLLWRLPHVWRDGDHLVIGDPRRGTRVALSEIESVKESRFQQVKTVTLELTRPTPLGRKVRFVPRGAGTFLIPISSSPVAAELRDAVQARRLETGDSRPEALTG